MRLKNHIWAVVASAFLSFCSISTAQAAGELQHITLSIYINPAGAPQAFLKDDLVHPLGLDVDILYELQRRLMFNINDNRIYPIPRQDGLERLRNGSADMVIGGISYTKERAEIYDFTPIFLRSSLGVLYSKRSNIKNEADLKGKRIGVEQDSVSAPFAQKFGATPVSFNNFTLAAFEVASGELDGLIYDRPPLDDFASAVKSANVAVTQHEFGQETCLFAFALTKNSPYTKIISKAINDMIADGTMDRILEKWKVKSL